MVDVGVDQASLERGDFCRETGLRCGVIGLGRCSFGGVGGGRDVKDNVGGLVVVPVLTGEGARVGGRMGVPAVSEGDAASGDS